MKANTLSLLFLAACGAVTTPVSPTDVPEDAAAPQTDAVIAPDAPPPMGSGSGSGSGSAIDPGIPTVSITGLVIDERGDAIDFSSGAPVHTHAGRQIDLSIGCPDVYKYAYLMDSTTPTYGHETSPNPLAWHVTATSPIGIDPNTTAYRVRSDANTVFADWTAFVPGSYDLTLYRDRIPALGTYDGTLYVDFRFSDTAGHKTVVSTCWKNHPLAAPLEYGSLQAASGAGSLAAMTLPADSPVSTVITGTQSYVAAAQEIVHTTAEPVVLSLSIAAPTASYRRAMYDGVVQTSTTNAGSGVRCGTDPHVSPDERCQTTAPTATGMTSDSGTLAYATWSAQVVDETTGAVTCGGTSLAFACTLPARADGEPAHTYRVELAFTNAPELWTSPGEYTVAGRTYTGSAPVTHYQCLAFGTSCGLSSCIATCTQYAVFAKFDALDQTAIDFGAASVQATSAITAMSYATTSTASLASFTWDAGTDVLPGQ